MGLTEEMEQRLFEMVVFSKNVEAVLNKKPRMELIVCNKNKFTKSKFNLRSLNKNEHEGFRFLHLNCTQE